MSNDKTISKELPNPTEVNTDEFFRAALDQMFEADNELTTITIPLKSQVDDTEATIRFKLVLDAINGVQTSFGKDVDKLVEELDN